MVNPPEVNCVESAGEAPGQASFLFPENKTTTIGALKCMTWPLGSPKMLENTLVYVKRLVSSTGLGGQAG